MHWIRTPLALIYGVLVFILSLTLAWCLMANLNFFYGVWHDYGGVGQGIERFGPKNRYKPGFAETTKAQREDVFAQIVQSIHEKGEGLADITYQSPASRGPQTLLRQPEVVHLQDVANLLSLLLKGVIAVLIVWVALSAYWMWRFGNVPSLKEQVSGVAGLLGLLFIILVIAGPENVFNTLHIWVFPKDHQWHFYYQESLMSTMMYAPLLFAWIAGAWLVLSICCFVLVNLVLGKVAGLILNRRA